MDKNRLSLYGQIEMSPQMTSLFVKLVLGGATCLRWAFSQILQCFAPSDCRFNIFFPFFSPHLLLVSVAVSRFKLVEMTVFTPFYLFEKIFLCREEFFFIHFDKVFSYRERIFIRFWKIYFFTLCWHLKK